ncbi:3'-5' exonuclease [Shewanella sp. PP-He15 brown]
MYEIAAELEGDYAIAIKDTFLSLIQGDIKNATRLIQLFLGDIKPIEDIDIDSVVVDSEFLKRISSESAQYPNLLRKFAEQSEYKEWMLFMHPDQESVAFKDFKGPSKLLGVSGSGKTCIVVQRAIYLAKKYPGKSILIVTLNKPLSFLIESLVQKLVEPEFSSQIEVRPFFSVCQELLNTFEPENKKLYEDVTWKSGEHIDAVWREFYRCELGNTDAAILHELHDNLISKNIDAEHYIKEEFDWIRSAFSKDERNGYLSIQREGRTIALNEKFRVNLLKGLDAWEKKMKDIGVTDYLNISSSLYRHINKINAKYRSVLIDESQDFGNIEFTIARKLVDENDNDIFLCGDAAQKISTKYQNLKEAGIELHGSRSKKIFRNYRNSKEILELANHILVENLTDEMMASEDYEILDPEYASFSGANPLLLKSKNLALEISSAIDYIKGNLKENQKACICIAGYSHREVQLYAESQKLPVLSGSVDIESASLFLSDLDQTKGFEFDFVCILNCNQGVIPDPYIPVEEHFRELSRLYVAMTRAKLELVISYSKKMSKLFENVDNYLIEDKWETFSSKGMKYYPVPEKMAEVVHEEDELFKNNLEMTGPTFLYRKEAIGLSSSLVELLRNKVTGKRLRMKLASGSYRINSWENIGDLIHDVNHRNAYEHKVNKSQVQELKEIEVKMSI